ncbi:hypothetical protein CleRT_06100 [Candidatus Coxiella mudrowiae]|uniref:Uncharacterized protein n=1 Tax=Candidatus Coxiella mudrowiae TaxID=2054173 RepID=A0ABM5UUF3_9COXI|nr:hypothetical protein CleRT_04660 [Candidatus Coxiella mudrowiae]AKQ33493.1 hypothetical protein CleRT_06100 [Candidatus Coxiella mudrowiae]
MKNSNVLSKGIVFFIALLLIIVIIGENSHYFLHRPVILTLYNYALTSILFSYVVLVLLFSWGLYNRRFTLILFLH